MPTLRFDDSGLLPVIAQDHLTGQVRMVAWANQEAIDSTLQTGLATFFSRSRQALWVKGETSGNTMAVRQVVADCDGDTLIYRVEPNGPSCHTGRPTCFFRRLDSSGRIRDVECDPGGFLLELESELEARKTSTAEKSYTRSLLDGGARKIGGKLREEAGELADAIGSESDERVASEAADLVYHLMVALRSRNVPLRRVIETLAVRAGVSGHEEKASRRG